jgi:hypothetical protein
MHNYNLSIYSQDYPAFFNYTLSFCLIYMLHQVSV